MDVFATGEHHNPPFYPSSPTTILGYIAAQTEKIILSTSTTLITTNDPVKIAEDFATLQHLADGRVDLVLGRGNMGAVYPWFGKNNQDSVELTVENYNLLRRLWDEEVVNWEGKHRTPLRGFARHPPPARRRRPLCLARRHPHAPGGRDRRVLRRRLLRQQHLLAQGALPAADQPLPRALRPLRPRHAGPGDRGPGRPVLHPAQLPGRRQGVPPLLRQRTGLRARPVAGGLHLADPADRGQPGGDDREDTRLCRDYFGDYQRQLFLIDHAGLPLKTVLEQLDLFGEEVLPTLRKEYAARNPAHVPEPPTPAGRVAAALAAGTVDAAAAETTIEGS